MKKHIRQEVIDLLEQNRKKITELSYEISQDIETARKKGWSITNKYIKKKQEELDWLCNVQNTIVEFYNYSTSKTEKTSVAIQAYLQLFPVVKKFSFEDLAIRFGWPLRMWKYAKQMDYQMELTEQMYELSRQLVDMQSAKVDMVELGGKEDWDGEKAIENWEKKHIPSSLEKWTKTNEKIKLDPVKEFPVWIKRDLARVYKSKWEEFKKYYTCR